jgi:hypothetical protein
MSSAAPAHVPLGDDAIGPDANKHDSGGDSSSTPMVGDAKSDSRSPAAVGQAGTSALSGVVASLDIGHAVALPNSGNAAAATVAVAPVPVPVPVAGAASAPVVTSAVPTVVGPASDSAAAPAPPPLSLLLPPLDPSETAVEIRGSPVLGPSARQRQWTAQQQTARGPPGPSSRSPSRSASPPMVPSDCESLPLTPMSALNGAGAVELAPALATATTGAVAASSHAPRTGAGPSRRPARRALRHAPPAIDTTGAAAAAVAAAAAESAPAAVSVASSTSSRAAEADAVIAAVSARPIAEPTRTFAGIRAHSAALSHRLLFRRPRMPSLALRRPCPVLCSLRGSFGGGRVVCIVLMYVYVCANARVQRFS